MSDFWGQNWLRVVNWVHIGVRGDGSTSSIEERGGNITNCLIVTPERNAFAFYYDYAYHILVDPENDNQVVAVFDKDWVEIMPSPGGEWWPGFDNAYGREGAIFMYTVGQFNR